MRRDGRAFILYQKAAAMGDHQAKVKANDLLADAFASNAMRPSTRAHFSS